jgi:hypothetical protein
VKVFLVIVFACSILVVVSEAVSNDDASSERDSGMKASIAERWGFAAVGKDENGRWEVVLENSVIRCRYGWKPINEDKGGESFITHLIIKENNQNQVGDEDSGGRIDAAAGRFEMLDASVKYDGTDFKTVQMSWKTQRPDFIASQAVTIFPDWPVLKVDYIKYCVNIVDIASPGGGENPKYTFYGGDKWKRDYVIYPKGYYYPPDDTHVVEQTGMPGDEGPGTLNYNCSFIMAIYNEKTGVGFGRVSPVEPTSIIKLLFNRGFELFPYWKKAKKPYSGYIFAFTQGADEAIELGKAIADGRIHR